MTNKGSLFLSDHYSRKEAEQLMLSMPFKIYEEMGVMSHSKYIGTIQLERQIAKRMNPEDIEQIRAACLAGIRKYYEE